ncbi:MFS transporter [Peptococcus simiae]|uniref:MFS transporter n=1 Tax=Peptococcus simiae TaxID=1643805 RepID=A0ABW9H211_9FIRM
MSQSSGPMPVLGKPAAIVALAVLTFNVCFISLYNISSISIALPLLMDEFKVSMSFIQWISIGYALAMGATSPLAGHLMRLYSLKRSMVVCLAGYTILAALSGLAHSLRMIIFFRALQGLCGAVFVPGTMVMIYQFIPRRYQTLFLTIQNVSLSLAPALAPIIAGVLIASLNWQWIFFINIPVGLLAVVLAAVCIPFEKGGDRLAIDWLGFGLVVAGCLAVFLSISLSSTPLGFSAPVIGLCLSGLCFLVLFGRQQKRSAMPIIDFSVLRNREYTLTLVGHVLSTILLAASPFIFAIMLQTGKGYSSAETASFMFAPALCAMVGAPLAQKLYSHLASKTVIAISWVLMAAGCLFIGLLGQVPLPALLALLAAQYLGLGMLGMPITDHGMRELPREQSNDGATLLNWICLLVTGLSVSVFTSIYERLNAYFIGHLAAAQACLESSQIIYIIIGIACLGGLLATFPLVKKAPGRS